MIIAEIMKKAQLPRPPLTLQMNIRIQIEIVFINFAVTKFDWEHESAETNRVIFTGDFAFIIVSLVIAPKLVNENHSVVELGALLNNKNLNRTDGLRLDDIAVKTGSHYLFTLATDTCYSRSCAVIAGTQKMISTERHNSISYMHNKYFWFSLPNA